MAEGRSNAGLTPGRFFYNKRWSFRQQLAWIMVLPLAMSAFVALAVHQAVSGMVDVEQRTELAVQSLALGRELKAVAVDMQTGVRGFVITGDEAFLAPYHQASARYEHLRADAAEVWRERDRRLQAIERIGALLSAFVEEVAEPIIERRRSMLGLGEWGSESVELAQELQDALAAGQDKSPIDEIRGIVRALVEADETELEAVMAVSERRRSIALAAGVAGPPIAVVIAMLLIGGLLRRVGRRLGQLAGVAASVRDGIYTEKLAMVDNREFSAVASGFDAMTDELERRRRRDILIDRLTRALQACNDADEAFSVVGSYLPRILPQVNGSVSMYRASRDLLLPVAQWGDGKQIASDPQVGQFEPDECRALKSGYEHECRPSEGDLACAHIGPQPEGQTLCVPLYGVNETLGVITIQATSGGDLIDADRRLTRLMAETIALSVSNLNLREALRNQSVRDPLTGLYNRRYLDECLVREVSRSERGGQPLSIVVLDADHFKRFNDTWGHDAGDEVLMSVAHLLMVQAREMDVACRLGGEEFLLLLPRTGHEEALGVAERIRVAAEQLKIRHEGRLLEPVTLSLGVATLPDHASGGQQLIKAADKALYRAKSEGRNRVAGS